MNLKTIIEETTTPAGRLFDLFVQVLIAASLVTFSVETLPNLTQETRAWLRTIEILTVISFSIEYVLRIFVADNKLRFIFSFYGLIDLLAILPFYLSTGIDLRSIRIFRFFRIFRALKLFRYSRAINRFQTAFSHIREELTLFIIAVLFLFYITGVGIYYFENPVQPDQFSSIFQSLWWSLITLTTVGYGDVYPITIGGKIFTAVVLLIGLGIVAVPTGLIASALSRTESD